MVKISFCYSVAVAPVPAMSSLAMMLPASWLLAAAVLLSRRRAAWTRSR